MQHLDLTIEHLMCSITETNCALEHPGLTMRHCANQIDYALATNVLLPWHAALCS
mgnify:CR=1 FL=1|jgi:hypothetical protein